MAAGGKIGGWGVGEGVWGEEKAFFDLCPVENEPRLFDPGKLLKERR